jgi:hypothetical protein
MKDLILIGAHCPDYEREILLNQFVDSLQNCREEYDILICSHIDVPTYITKKVDYIFVDNNNELITDIKYLNQPWFSPFEGFTILSTYITNYSTYLAVYRLLILGLGFAKMFNYKKVHYIEYDTLMNDLNELYDNSKLLDKYDNVVIQKEQRNFEDNLNWPIGNFMSFKTDSINDVFTTYDREKLIELLSKSPSKTNEKITNDIININGNKVYVKNFDDVVSKDIKFGLSHKTSKESMSYWAVPFYNTEKDILSLVVWNNKNENPINVKFIINDDRIVTFNNIKKFEWKLQDIGDIKDVRSVLVLVDDKVKTKIELNENNLEIFKRTNYSLNE